MPDPMSTRRAAANAKAKSAPPQKVARSDGSFLAVRLHRPYRCIITPPAKGARTRLMFATGGAGRSRFGRSHLVSAPHRPPKSRNPRAASAGLACRETPVAWRTDEIPISASASKTIWRRSSNRISMAGLRWWRKYYARCRLTHQLRCAAA